MRTSNEQYLILIEFMEKYGDLAKPSTGPRGRNYVALKWAQLTLQLNSEGSGESRSEDRWRKVWSDYKNNIKKKLAKINKAANKTGGGPALNLYLNDLEKRVASLIGSQAATGIETIPEAGLMIQTEAQNSIDGPNIPVRIDVKIEPVETIEEVINIVSPSGSEDKERWNQPPPSKRSRPNVETANAFLECERQSRKDARDRDRMYERFELERIRQRDEELRLRELEITERVRQRDDEIQMQGRWMDLIAECLSVFREYMAKKD